MHSAFKMEQRAAVPFEHVSRLVAPTSRDIYQRASWKANARAPAKPLTPLTASEHLIILESEPAG